MIVFLLLAALQNPVISTPAGEWKGTITANGMQTPMSLTVTRDSAGAYVGLITARDLAFVRAPLLSPLRVPDSTVIFLAGLSEGALRFQGTITDRTIRGSVYEIGMVNGDWTPLGDTVPFVLRRSTGSAAAPPYLMRDTTLTSGNRRLAGTLFIPRLGNRKNKMPGVVFVHGSGPSSRDEGNFLADHFARRGYVALIYDKRGVGGSGGDWTRAAVPDLADDALAGLTFLSRLDVVDKNNVGLAGISQAGWVIENAASRSALVRFIMLQAGPVQKPLINGSWRFRQRLGQAGISSSDSRKALAFLRRDDQVSATGAGLEDLMRDVAKVKDSAWFKALGWEPDPIDDEYRRWSSLINGYDPAGDLDKIKARGIWFYGYGDKAVDGRAEASAAYRWRATSRSNQRVVVLPEADHGMRIDEPGKRIFPHLHPAFLGELDRWIDSLSSNGKGPRSSTSDLSNTCAGSG